MKMSMWLEKILLWVNILPCQIVLGKVPCGQVPVDRVCIGESSHGQSSWILIRCLGIQFCLQIKNVVDLITQVLI